MSLHDREGILTMRAVRAESAEGAWRKAQTEWPYELGYVPLGGRVVIERTQ